MPAKAGIHLLAMYALPGWIPAFAGMTKQKTSVLSVSSVVKNLLTLFFKWKLVAENRRN